MPVEPDRIRRLVSQAVDEALGGKGDPVEGFGREEATPGDARTVAVGADHGGVELKNTVAAHLKDTGYQVIDCGTDGPESVDYPDFALAVAEKVADGSAAVGMVVDGAGIGSAMAANKVPGVRAALCYDISSAVNSREHNHANVLTLGAGLVGRSLALQIVDAWLATPHGGGRHARRVAKIADIEGKYARRSNNSGESHNLTGK